MKRKITNLFILAAALLVLACGGKKKTDDIITQKVEKPQPQAPIRQQEYLQERDVQWIGKTYHLAVNRQPSDSLPMVKDETGQQFVDNAITVVVSRADGSIFYSHTFTKSSFSAQLDDDYRRTGILEGFVFNKADGDYLEFAASVSHPQTDEYIPLVVRLSRMGDVSIKCDTSLDTASRSEDDDV